MRLIKYIGRGREKRDNVLRTRRIWKRGESLPVTEDEAATYIQYPDMWADVSEQTPPQEPEVPEVPNPPSTPPQEPVGNERASKIAQAIGELDPKSAEDFTAQGKPRVKRVEAKLGFDVDMEEVQSVFDSMKADG